MNIAAFQTILRRYKKRVNGYCARTIPGISEAVAAAESPAAMYRIKVMPELQLVGSAGSPIPAAIPIAAAVDGVAAAAMGDDQDDALAQLAAVAAAAVGWKSPSFSSWS